MGELLTAYKARYSDLLLVAASNPQDSTATAQDATRQTNAETDVINDFQDECGAVFDSSNAQHINICVQGLHAKLLVYVGQADQSMYDNWISKLERRKLVLGRDRLVPGTSSPLTPSVEASGAKPLTDLKTFAGYRPGQPSSRRNPANQD